MKAIAFLLALTAFACRDAERPLAVAASAAPPVAAVETPEDPPYAPDSVFKPETHREAAAAPPRGALLLRDALLPNDDDYSHLGESVAIDGDVAVAGAPYADAGAKTHAGAAFVFLRANGKWRTAAKLLAPEPLSYERFGMSVAVAGDTIVVGADRSDRVAYDAGAAFVFRREGDAWQHTKTLTPRTLPVRSAFGFSVAIDGTTIVVGAPGAAEAHVFAGNLHGVLRPPASLQYSGFGHDVAVDGDAILIGANTTSDPLLLGGSAYVFRRRGTAWNLESELRSPHDEAQARFGTAVDILGNVALVGASRATLGESTRAGAAFVFEKRGSAWQHVAKLTNSPYRSDEEFGRALALLPGAAVVGSQFGDAAGLNTGGAQLYVVENGRWLRKGALLAGDRTAIAEFAFAVAASDREVIIGAPRRNSSATATGAAYIFSHGGSR